MISALNGSGKAGFKNVHSLMSVCESITFLRSVCMRCRDHDGVFTVRRNSKKVGRMENEFKRILNMFFYFDFMNFSNFFQLHHGKGKKKPFPGILTGLITKEALGGLEKYQTLCRRCFLRD